MNNQRFTLFGILLFLNFNLCFSQVKKGEFIFPINLSIQNRLNSGGITFYNSPIRNPDNYSKSAVFTIDSRISTGFAIFKNTVIGVSSKNSIKKNSSKFWDGSQYRSNHYTESLNLFGLFSRYYILNKRNGIFMEGAYYKAKPKNYFLGQDEDDRIENAKAKVQLLGLGYNYFVSQKISLEVIATYSKNRYLANIKFRGDQSGLKMIDESFNEVKLNAGICFHLNN